MLDVSFFGRREITYSTSAVLIVAYTFLFDRYKSDIVLQVAAILSDREDRKRTVLSYKDDKHRLVLSRDKLKYNGLNDWVQESVTL